jgi:hypothetical protein
LSGDFIGSKGRKKEIGFVEPQEQARGDFIGVDLFVRIQEAVEKVIRVLRQAQHERKIISNFASRPVRPETLEG